MDGVVVAVCGGGVLDEFVDSCRAVAHRFDDRRVDVHLLEVAEQALAGREIFIGDLGVDRFVGGFLALEVLVELGDRSDAFEIDAELVVLIEDLLDEPLGGVAVGRAARVVVAESFEDAFVARHAGGVEHGVVAGCQSFDEVLGVVDRLRAESLRGGRDRCGVEDADAFEGRCGDIEGLALSCVEGADVAGGEGLVGQVARGGAEAPEPGACGVLLLVRIGAADGPCVRGDGVVIDGEVLDGRGE